MITVKRFQFPLEILNFLMSILTLFCCRSRGEKHINQSPPTWNRDDLASADFTVKVKQVGPVLGGGVYHWHLDLRGVI